MWPSPTALVTAEPVPALTEEPKEERQAKEEVGAPGRTSSRATAAPQIERLVSAIRNGNEEMVESSIRAPSQRSRWLAALALVVGRSPCSSKESSSGRPTGA